MATKKKKSRAQLQTSLPGEAAADTKLLKQAVQHINRTTTQAELEAALHVGRYVLETFFGGSAETYRDRSAAHVSFQRLASDGKLQVSAQWLWAAVNVAIQYDLLPEVARDSISLSHHRMLLPIKSPEKKSALAQKAADKGWTKRQLEAQVTRARKAQGNEGRTGRPRRPSFLKGLRTLQSAADLIAEEIDWDDPFPGYSDDGASKEAAAAREMLDAAEHQLEEMRRFVKQAKRKLARRRRD